MRAFAPLLAFVVVLSTMGTVGAGADGSATASPNVAVDPPRSVAVADVVSVNRSNRSGVHPVEPGSTLLVRGTTNRRPDDNAIDLSVTAGPDADRFGFVVVESWGDDGRWTARLTVPTDITPGTYTLEVRLDGDVDIQRFEVAERRPTGLGRASLSDTVRTVSGERVPAGRVAVENVTLPDGGYVEIRDAGTPVGRSSYLDPGTHAVVTVGATVYEDSSLRAVAVRGTPDRVGDPYRYSNDSTVAVQVPFNPIGFPPSPTPTATPAPTPTATPTATPAPTPTATPAPTATPTDATAPGFGTLAIMIALALWAAVLLSRARTR